MNIYIAFLRGINVGGKNKIKMADLKSMFESIGLTGIETYIQSGNVLFKSDEKEDILQKKIQDEIERIFGFTVAVILRTAAELENIICDCPFSKEEITRVELSNTEGESFYVSLLTHAPIQEKIEYINTKKNESDEYRIKNRDIYLLFHRGIRNSGLANNLQKLDILSTIRNWKTISKLNSLAKQREIG
jgi:uncharacterized protein (DUF1697 family)